ncbi:MAG: hypothetical protein ACO4B4_13850, partial [Planctomycetota bacterium]
EPHAPLLHPRRFPRLLALRLASRRMVPLAPAVGRVPTGVSARAPAEGAPMPVEIIHCPT